MLSRLSLPGLSGPLLVPDEGAADDQALDLARSLVQPKQPDLAVDPLDRGSVGQIISFETAFSNRLVAETVEALRTVTY
jgi:hypothetical protein